MNLILPEPGWVVICDFKTAAISQPPPEIRLSCYSYLFRQVSGEQEAALEIRSLVKTNVCRDWIMISMSQVAGKPAGPEYEAIAAKSIVDLRAGHTRGKTCGARGR